MMSNKLDNFETVCEGWLTKSPPTTRIWRARWRRRWFILRHSGELPGQYFLCYYTDRNCRKLKGQIDLDQCEQVDAGLRFESRKQKYQHMFTIRTPKRIYYLAAESEEDMNKWVDCVCHVCGLKPFITEDVVIDDREYYEDGDNISQAATGVTDLSPPVTPYTIITGPYIPISECISGKPINSAEDLKQFLLLHGNANKAPVTIAPVTDHRPDSYDLPRSLRPPPEIQVEVGTTPPPSPGSESVFTDDESARRPSVSKKPTVNWETFPRPSDSSVDGEDSPSLGTAAITVKADRKFAKVVGPVPMAAAAPPRPPKPSHLANVDQTSAPGTDSAAGPPAEPTQDEMYDIPRSHQMPPDLDVAKKVAGRHCYTNAAPGHVSENNIFRYDFTMTVTNSDDIPDSPRSESGSISFSNTLAYSNLPSPSYSTGNQIVPTPPSVNRELKPGRKCSDSTGGSNEPSPIPPTAYPPNIDRKLKPLKKIQDGLRQNENINSSGTLKLCSPPVGSLGRRKQRAGPSPTPPNNPSKGYDNGSATTGRVNRRHSSSDDRLDQDKEEIQFYQINNHTYHTRTRNSKNNKSKKFSEIQYLDLDLDSSDNANVSGLVNKSSKNIHSPATATVYKTVDFVRTEAFNRTRIEIEEERSRLCMAAESAS